MIADVRARVSGAVWLVGTSRGTLSAANAACLRSPASAMESVAARIGSTRKQVVTVTGGPGAPTGPQAGIEACVSRAPHGFTEQEAEVAAGIARFVRGGLY